MTCDRGDSWSFDALMQLAWFHGPITLSVGGTHGVDYTISLRGQMFTDSTMSEAIQQALARFPVTRLGRTE